MNDFLPSRKVFAFLLIPIITVFLLWAVNAYYSTPVVKQQEEDKLALVINEGSRQFQDRDTDGDGLKDWEEFLYQTDERNPDTDGDGASDGAEVKRGNDPLTIGNGTSTDGVAPENQSDFSFYREDPDLTKTDVLARDIFIAYAELRGADSLEVESIRDDAINKAIRESTDQTNVLTYNLENTLVAPVTNTAKSAYKRGYSESLQQLSSIQFSELELFSRYVNDNDPDALTELNKNKLAYQEFVNSLAGVAAPEDIHPIHVELLNNVSIIISSIEGMAQVDVDPLTALVAGQKFLEDEKVLYSNIEAISLYFRVNGL